MPPQTIKKAIKDTLEDLSKLDFDKFRHALLDRREEPRVRRNKVEGKNFLEITDVLVSTFAEPGALKVTVEILREIDCNNEADRLVEDCGGQSSKPSSSDTASSSAGAAGAETMADGKHFVDKHQLELKRRANNIAPILDELLFRGVIDQENYERIRKLPTSQAMMREIYSGCLQGGTACKDIFYEALKKNESFLIEDLKKSN